MACESARWSTRTSGSPIDTVINESSRPTSAIRPTSRRRRPDANADVDVSAVPEGDRIRLGDPNTTVTGQHRYVLAYTLPDAQLSSGQLALDIIGTAEELETDRFEVVVRGMALSDPTCNVGHFGDCRRLHAGARR